MQDTMQLPINMILKHNNLLIKLNTNTGVFAGFYHGFYRFFPTVPAKIVFAMAKTQP